MINNVINTPKKIRFTKLKNIKIVVKTNLIIIIIPYSARKIIANPLLLYSTLNPETNSDSPSEKSNGVRLVSLRIDTIHIIKNTDIKIEKLIIC